MNKKTIIYIPIAILAVACAKEPVFDQSAGSESLIPLQIDGAISQIQTRATAEGFVDKDAVGLFAVNYTENNTMAGELLLSGNQADNVKYVFDESNHKWTPVKPVYYKNINTNVDLYLYYPHRAEINDIEEATFEVQKDQSSAASVSSLSGYEASDWLWGKAENITPSESRVRIPLSHRLAAVQVTLGEGSGFEEGEFDALEKSVLLTGTTRKATLNFATGTATPVGSAQLDGIVMCPQTDGSFRAVVIPQSVAAATRLFAITIDGISYSFKQNAAVEYQQGKQLSFTININKKSPAGEYALELADIQIVDWKEDLNSHGGEARQYYVVNVETPGTLGRLIKAAGKNPNKIRNLKVTGSVTTNDFYFMRDSMSILEAVNMKESKVVNGLLLDKSYSNDVIPINAFKNKTTLTKFVFPETITRIEQGAFSRTLLAGHITLPNTLQYLGIKDSYSLEWGVFLDTKISSITFPDGLKVIGYAAFSGCSSLTGSLLIPDSVEYIADRAFEKCNFSGILHLPENVEYIGTCAFDHSGSFNGDLVIPEKITSLPGSVFSYTRFSGSLSLSNLTEAVGAFTDCHFTGELVIPEGIVQLQRLAFRGNDFSSIVLPSTLRVIGESAFSNCPIITPLVIPEGVITIEDNAFSSCNNIPEIYLPSTLQTISAGAFDRCYGVSKIVSNSIEPPTVINSNAFNGIGKDNFNIEVPSQSVKQYQSEYGWSDFKRITAHYDFSLSRARMRSLNGSISRVYILRAPSNNNWSLLSKPEWVSVTPSSGTGKTDITVTVNEMTSSEASSFEVNEGTYNSPSYKTYSGRAGEIVFLLNDKDYTCSMTVEQYNYNYPDGYVKTLQTATKGAGIDIVFTGDGYDAKDIAKGTFLSNVEEGYGHFFDVEPYKTYKDYFNVYAVTAMSDESGIGTLNTIIDTKFGSTFTQKRILLSNPEDVFSWAKKADISMDLSKSLVILLQNSSTYEGVTMMYTDGSAIACCPVSQISYPYDFRGIIQHEAGGHGFGKLADEYIYHNAFIQNCICLDGCEHPQSDNDMDTSYGRFKSLGWYKNLSMTSDVTRVPWAHLIYNSKYSDYVDMYEGGYMHSRGIYRSEATSCMNNNIPYYSAISRQAIVERIMEYAGEEFTLEKFYANDKDTFGTITRAGFTTADRTFGVDPKFVRSTGLGPVFMGEKPNVK